ncbi:MAG: hypothetical protein KME64_29515 [Scytonematopsis contorta HA4267-MV1]|jgi:hypothetical protein|nr:hypothetical protein [Scytonematopsis contorta HA4267-MV1]
MAIVRSTWAERPIFIGKFPFPVGSPILSPQEWSQAGIMPIPNGYLMVKNNAEFLYVALDLVNDQGQDSGTGDYFWLSIDVDNNRQITPNRDINYALYPGQPNRLGRQYYLGPGVWTGILNEESESLVRIGFEGSPNSSTPHRIWEMRLSLKELGVDLNASTIPPSVRFGLRVASTNPQFTFDFPLNFFRDFSNLHEIILARFADPKYPPLTAGDVIGGVGLIPATKISADGYANTDASYIPFVTDTAFGGILNFIGNRVTMQNLWNLGARKYRVLSRFLGSSPSEFSSVRQTWSNYRWGGTNYVLEYFGPDAQQNYPLLNPADDYSIDDLLLQWNSVGVSAGVHQFKVQFFQADGVTIVPSTEQFLNLRIDNNLPRVEIANILYNGNPIPVCAIQRLSSSSDGIQFNITVNDPEGNLGSYELRAYYGDGWSSYITGDSYTNHQNPSRQWQGVNNSLVPSGKWIPPVTCAYQFRLSASPRVTNGYSYIGYVEATKHITLIKSEGSTSVAGKFSSELPLGMTQDGSITPGEEPAKLG